MCEWKQLLCLNMKNHIAYKPDAIQLEKLRQLVNNHHCYSKKSLGFYINLSYMTFQRNVDKEFFSTHAMLEYQSSSFLPKCLESTNIQLVCQILKLKCFNLGLSIVESWEINAYRTTSTRAGAKSVFRTLIAILASLNR